MTFRALALRNLVSGEAREVSDFVGQNVQALAGIGNSAGFFAQLRDLGLEVHEHAFPDHHAFRSEDLAFDDGTPLIMTEKDAVKCTGFARANHWYLAIEASPDPGFDKLILKLLEAKRGG